MRTASNSSGTTASFHCDPFGQVQHTTIVNGSTELRDDRHFGSLITKRRQKSPAVGSVSYIDRRFPGAGFTVSRRGKPGAPWIYELGESRGVLFTTSANGMFTQDTDYAPFGEVTFNAGAEPGALPYSTQQWNGGDALDDLGLVYVGARIYDPVIGRFLSRDPLMIPRTAATSNPYAFAFNDPVNFSDRLGLSPCRGDGNCEGDSDDIDPISGLLSLGGWALHNLRSNPSGSGAGSPTGPRSRSYLLIAMVNGAISASSSPIASLPAGTTVADVSPWRVKRAMGRDYSAAGPPALNPVAWILAAPDDPDSGMPPFHMKAQLVMTLGPMAVASIESTAARVALVEEAAELFAARGLPSGLSGQIFGATNEAGGTVWTSEGLVAAEDFDGYVLSALEYGEEGTPVNVITGAHGEATGAMNADLGMFQFDQSRWGQLGANVLNVADPAHAAAITGALRGPGTTVGAFCNSGVCLKAFLP